MGDDGGEIDDRWLFRTSGPNCHWCYTGMTAFVWGPYGTNVCAHCQCLFDEGRQWEVPETLAARMTVRDRWMGADPEQWREREHRLIAKWLTIRTTCAAVDSEEPPTFGA